MSMNHADAVFFEDDTAFETWLVDNASTATHVWIRRRGQAAAVGHPRPVRSNETPRLRQ